MPYTIGSGYTTSDIKCYPLAASGPTIGSGASAWTFGSWVEVVPANTITVDFSLLAVICFIDPAAAIDVRHEGLLEIGIGAAGSEVTIVQVPFSYFIDSAAGHCMEQVIEIYPRKIPANSRVALRIADDVASALTYGGCKIQYFEALDTYSDDKISCYPTASAGVQPVSSATAWAWGSWVELVPPNTIAGPFDITDINFLFPPVGLTKDVRYQAVIQIGVGAAGSETPIISLPVHFLSDTLVDHVPDNQVVFLPVPRRVAANSRVAVRAANDGAVALTYGPIKIRYIKAAVVVEINLFEPAISFSDALSRQPSRPLLESAVSILAETIARAVQRQLSEASISIPTETLTRLVSRVLSEPSLSFTDAVEKSVQRNISLNEAAVSIVAETLVREVGRTLSEAAVSIPDETLIRFISRALSEPSQAFSDSLAREAQRILSEVAISASDALAREVRRALLEPSIPFSDSLIRMVSFSLSEISLSFSDSIIIEVIPGGPPPPSGKKWRTHVWPVTHIHTPKVM